MNAYITSGSTGFAVTTEAYRQFIRYNDYNHLAAKLKAALKDLNRPGYTNLAAVGDQARQLMYCATMPDDVAKAISDAYTAMAGGPDAKVDITGIVTDEHQPPGRDGSFHTICGESSVIDAVQMCFVSLYSDKAIRRREENAIPHEKTTISIQVKAAPCSQ